MFNLISLHIYMDANEKHLKIRMTKKNYKSRFKYLNTFYNLTVNIIYYLRFKDNNNNKYLLYKINFQTKKIYTYAYNKKFNIFKQIKKVYKQ